MRGICAALALSACTVPPDIVALVTPTIPPPEDAGSPIVDAGCPLFLWSDGGALSRLAAEKSAPLRLVTPDCLTSGVKASAVDQSGAIWVQARDGSSWYLATNSFLCKTIGWSHRPSALSFVYTPEERLFAVEDGRLFEIDLGTFEPRTLGTIDKGARLLDDGGDLLALSTVEDGLLALDRIEVNDGGITEQRRIEASGLLDATYWRGELTMLLGAQLVRYRADQLDLQFLSELEPNSYDGLFAPRCLK